MKRGNITIFSLPIALVVMTFFSLTAYSQNFYRDYIDGEIYLKFKDNIQVNIPINEDKSVDLDRAPFLSSIMQQYDISGLTRPYDFNNDPKLLRTFKLHFSEFDKIEEIKELLELNPDLEYVENVPACYIDYTPNDTLYNRVYGSNNWNWHLDVISAEMAWDVSMGSPDIKVAIVDNAVWIDHPDLANKIILSEDVTQPGNQNSNPPTGGDASAWSHGTHCAGLAAAESDNLIGVASIGFEVSLMGVKCSSSNPDLINGGYGGINWAASNGADVISCSWGGSGYSTTEQNVINSVYNMGIVVVAAAGNTNVNTPHYPSSYNHVISVASTDETDVKTNFSNYGATVDVCAPGGYSASGTYGLLSTTWDFTNFGYYDLFAGTSMACPLTAGLCGLILSVNPDLTPDELEDILESGCDDIYSVPGNEGYAGQLGAGRINAYASISTTPFAPTSDFSTPVTILTPGSTVQFFDMSTGVPDSWSWEFTGGSPHLSSVQNPFVLFADEGVYTIYLAVENDFGLDVETKTDYITVTNTPLPWVEYSASANTACITEIIVFTDETLYNPTAWSWEFDPSTVSFVDETTMNSQHPHVTFDESGLYSVTLTATNANGTNFKMTEDMIDVAGILPNYIEDFESGESSDFMLSSNTRANVKVDTRAAAPGSTNGLHFEGSNSTGGWSGGPINTTADQAWNVNTQFHGFAEVCGVDATNIEGIGLTLDLRQTYSVGYTYSWFRVLANDEQISDIYGVADFNPVTNEDPFEMITFDLSEYGNSLFTLTLQSACLYADKFFAEGDNVFVDNIMISNITAVQEGSPATTGVLTYPNPAKEVLNFSAHGTGEQINVKVMNIQGQTIFEETIKGYHDGDVHQVKTADLSNGIYILKISGEKGTTVKKFVID